MLARFLDDYLQRTQDIATQLDTTRIAEAIGWLRQTRDAGASIFVAGNGGSATIAAHLVVALVKCGSFGKAKRFRAINLADSVSTLTAYANDEGYETVFSEPLRSFARDGDLLVTISGSGSSPNILRAVEAAHELGCRTIALTSDQQGELRHLAQLPLLVPSSHMGRLEDSYFLLTHLLVYPFIEDVDGA